MQDSHNLLEFVLAFILRKLHYNTSVNMHFISVMFAYAATKCTPSELLILHAENCENEHTKQIAATAPHTVMLYNDWLINWPH